MYNVLAMATTTKTTKKPSPKKSTATGAFAVIATGGKQYRVMEGQSINIEKIKGEYKKGDILTFDQVLLTDDGTTTVIGTPTIAGKTVTAVIESISRAPKVIVIKYKQKSRYFKKNGHRQPFFKIKIQTI